MNTGDALLRACLENPDEDTPRLAYADWLDENGDPDRAEFIRTHIELDRRERGELPRAGLMARWYRLLAAHEAEWKPVPAHVRGCVHFVRGLLEYASVETDEQAQFVAWCPGIRFLSLRGHTLTDAGVFHLAAIAHLEELSLPGVPFRVRGAEAFAHHRRLRRVWLDGTRNPREWFEQFRHAPRLVRIYIDGVGGNGITSEEWSAWEEERAARFRAASAEDRQRAARAFPFARARLGEGEVGRDTMSLPDGRVSDADVEILAGLVGVRVLDLRENTITGRTLHHLRGLGGLQALRLTRNPIENLDGLTGMIGLRELDVSETRHRFSTGHAGTLTDAGTTALATLTGLERLNLSYNPITDATLARLAGLRQLRRLVLGSADGITNAGLRHLSGLKNLEYLDVESTGVTATGAGKLLMQIPRLRIEGVE